VADAQSTRPDSQPVPDMVWIPGGTFLMGSDHHYPEEAPAHQVSVDGFWIDRYTVTNADFARFVHKTGHRTVAERAADPADYPGAKPEMLVPASTVFRQPPHRVDLRNHYNWWTYVPAANWRCPQGPGSSIRKRPDHPVAHVAWDDVQAYAAWAGKHLPTEAEWELACRGGLDGAEFAWGEELNPGGRWMANTWQGEFPIQNTKQDGYRLVPSPRRAGRCLLHDGQPARWRTTAKHGPERPAGDPAQGDEGRLAPVRSKLLPAVSAGRPNAPSGRYRNLPPGVPLHPPTGQDQRRRLTVRLGEDR
jgi:formylglycine-generating enzyme required for sulfatase activity